VRLQRSDRCRHEFLESCLPCLCDRRLPRATAEPT
jgi:hypothetical protein